MAQESIIETRKYYKRNKVLNLIRTHPNCSRFDLKKMTSYSMATVLGIIEELSQSGLINEEEASSTKVGRKPTWLRINPAFGTFIGLEFHSGRINCAMLDFGGQKLFQDWRGLEEDATLEHILRQMSDLIEGAIAAPAGRGRLLGIGIGVAGYFSAETGIATAYPPLKNWVNVPIRQYIEEKFACECFIENNVTCLAIGYKHLHLPAGPQEDFIFASVRSGVRIVPYIGGAFLLSNKGYAGQLGHTRVPGSNRLCLCGRRGCLNNEVANPGLRAKIIEAVLVDRMQGLFALAGGDIRGLTVPLFIQSALEGDAESLELLEETACYLGQSLGTMLDILAPRQLIVYGELCRTGEAFKAPLQASLEENAMRDNTRSLRLTLCPPDESMGALGAASMVMQKQFEYLDEIV